MAGPGLDAAFVPAQVGAILTSSLYFCVPGADRMNGPADYADMLTLDQTLLHAKQ